MRSPLKTWLVLCFVFFYYSDNYFVRVVFFCNFDIMVLTVKQEAYCQAFVELGDKSAAYRRAYNTEKMKPESVNRKAFEVHENVNITSRIDELQNEIKERNKIKIDDVLSVLTDMIKFDISELYNEDGSLKSIHDIPKHHRQMISSIKVFEERLSGKLIGETKEIKTLNKLDVIEKFMKHLGGYEKDNKQKKTTIDLGNLTTAELIERAKALKNLDE